jgi:hypothetical protein
MMVTDLLLLVIVVGVLALALGAESRPHALAELGFLG